MEKFKLHSINIGEPKEIADKEGTWITAYGKKPREGSIYVRKTGIEGDSQANKKAHGGPEQAVLMYSADHYPSWRLELGQEFPYGGFGENLTISGLDENTVCVGDIYKIGEVKLQVTKPRSPCWKISRFWGISDLMERVRETNRTGWYCRVIEEGIIESGMTVELIERSNPGETIRNLSKS